MIKLPKIRLWLAALATAGVVGLAIQVAYAIGAFNPANMPVGYVAQDEMTNYNLKAGNVLLFRGEFERESWSGSFYAYPIDEDGLIINDAWESGRDEYLGGQNFNTGRLIATMKDTGVAVPFRHSELSAAQQTALGSSALLDFLRGDRSGEGTSFRVRKRVLGAIVHSRPFYVADTVNPTVFVGANDGMLHAFNAAANGGTERWAYVPSMLMPKLKSLSVDPYVPDYFVDGQINVAQIDSGTQRILVGALGAGGKGLYALDITGSAGLGATTETDVANKVMWEISPTKLNYANPTTANAYVNLGYTFGVVTIAKVAGVDAVIIGNGYNDGTGSYAGCEHATPNYANCGGNYAAYLYVINADTGQLISAIKAGANGTAADPNGLSSAAAVDSDGDGSVDRVYAGDLNGTMWKFDLTAATATALITTSPAQAITATPGVAAHPNGGYMVTFGTGKTFTSADITDDSVHYAYGIWDGAPVANAAMLTQTLTERSFTNASGTVRVRRVTSNQPNWTSGVANHRGWKVALPRGERVLGEGSFIENGRFYFTANNPTISTTIPTTTTVVSGESWLMELDYLSGGSKNQPFLDLSGDVKLDENDRIKYIATDPEVIATPSKLDTPIMDTDGIAVAKFISIGVLSQPVLVQQVSLNDTLFNQNPDVTVPPVVLGQGVDNGHFDQDIFYGTGVATKAAGHVTFNYGDSRTAFNVTFLSIVANGETVYSGTPGSQTPRNLDDFLNGKSSANYILSANSLSNTTVRITAKNGGAAFNGPVTVTMTVTGGAIPGFVKFDMTGGLDASSGDSCLTCTSKKHVHQYDDKYDVTGVNFLNPSDTGMNFALMVPSETTQFKILVQNQYLNPAVRLHFGNPGYLFNINAGYVAIKDYQANETALDLATVQTYVRAATATAPVKSIGSLAFNLPVDGLTARDWWGTGDVRVGLLPMKTTCMRDSAGVNDGNMYKPVVPPANGVDGPGTQGWSALTTPATATGVRHGGAFVIQIIAANTPNSAIEMQLPGRPEYGWRVKSAFFSTYVLGEYSTFWHHPNGLCYYEAGWTKTPGPDNGSSTAVAKAAGSTDPKIGEFGVGAGTITNVSTTTVGNVTTTIITYSSGLQASIVRTTRNDGSVEIVTKDTICMSSGNCPGVTQIIANTAGAVRSGGDERGLQARTGRISWRELVAP